MSFCYNIIIDDINLSFKNNKVSMYLFNKSKYI